MTSGSRRHRVAGLLLGALLPWTAVAAMAVAIDADSLLARIKITPPATIAFTEVRFSRLLKQPLIVSGRLGFLAVDQLDRTIDKPYSERTEIRGTLVKVVREGERERTFGLTRAPELQTLVNTLSALLSGNRAALERDFRVEAQADADGPGRWTLTLTPRDTRGARRLQSVSLIGSDNTAHCFSIATQDGGVSFMLFEGAAHLPTPAASITPESLAKHCRAAQA